MKSNKIMVGLLALSIVTQIHGSEPHIPRSKIKSSALDKNAQKEFRKALALYRGMYTHQQLLEKTDGKEVKIETQVRLDLEEALNQYHLNHGNDPYVANKLQRLEKFKNKEIPNRFKQLSQLT